MKNRITGLLIACAALPLAVGCSSDGDSSSDVNTGVAQVQSLDQWVVRVTDMDETEIVDRFVSDDGTQGVVVLHWVGVRSDNGEPFDLEMTQVYEYDDGKIVNIDVSWANADAREQLRG